MSCNSPSHLQSVTLYLCLEWESFNLRTHVGNQRWRSLTKIGYEAACFSARTNDSNEIPTAIIMFSRSVDTIRLLLSRRKVWSCYLTLIVFLIAAIILLLLSHDVITRTYTRRCLRTRATIGPVRRQCFLRKDAEAVVFISIFRRRHSSIYHPRSSTIIMKRYWTID